MEKICKLHGTELIQLLPAGTESSGWHRDVIGVRINAMERGKDKGKKGEK
jgi:hypothetical protein